MACQSSNTSLASRILGVDSFSILFNHRSFQKPDRCFPKTLGIFLQKEGCLERMGMAPLE